MNIIDEFLALSYDANNRPLSKDESKRLSDLIFTIRELESRNEKLQKVIDETKELLDKVLSMNQGDFDFYARTELRNKNEELKSILSEVEE